MSETPAGWYPDPNDPSSNRYWDGQQWTEHKSPAHTEAGAGETVHEETAQQPQQPQQAAQPAYQQAATSPTGPSNSNRNLLIGGGVALVVAAVVAFLVLGGGDDGGGYPDDAKDEYLSQCESASGGQTDYCECTLDKIEQEIPYDEFEEIDADIAGGGSVPDELQAIITECLSSELDT